MNRYDTLTFTAIKYVLNTCTGYILDITPGNTGTGLVQIVMTLHKGLHGM